MQAPTTQPATGLMVSVTVNIYIYIFLIFLLSKADHMIPGGTFNPSKR